jgi:hypothetical protein
MSKSNSRVYKPLIYPAYTFRASPTYFAWVKLTVADIHALRSERGYEGTDLPSPLVEKVMSIDKRSRTGQNLYFHLNHPIRFVCITAPIIEIEDVLSKYALLTLDDGSSAAIVVKITRLEKKVLDKHDVELESNTTVSNVNIPTGPGISSQFCVEVDGEALDIGTVVKVKGTIEEFRAVKQIKLVRVKVVRSTAEEVREWEQVARWKDDTLSSPWYLGKRKLKELEERVEWDARRRAEEERKKEEAQAAKALKKKHWADKIRRYEEKREMKRRKEELMFNAGALI